MYTVSTNFLNAIKEPSRIVSSKVLIRDVEYSDDYIIEISTDESVNPEDSFALGSTASTKLDIALIDITGVIFEGAEIKPYIGLEVDGMAEYVPLGVFTVDKISKIKDTIKLECFDNMIKTEKAYFSDLNYPASINDVAQEICTKAGITLSGTLPNTQINKIEGYTCREAIKLIASFLGGFARFNRLGQLEFATYTDSDIDITGDHYFKFETGEKVFSIGKITCKVDETTTLTAGTTGNEIQLENPIMTQAQLNNIYNTLKTLSYMPYTMDWQGNPALMAGDIISITDINDVVYTTLLMEQKLSYKGGLKATASAKAKTDTAQEFSSSGTLTQKMERYSIEQAHIKVLLAETATIVDLQSERARINDLYATRATVVDLNASNARINNLETNSATIIQLNAEKARIDDLKVNSATITQLNVEKARITILEGDVASIDTILAKEIFVELATAGKIVAGSTIIADGAIGSAQITDLSASKLSAGIADLSIVTIQGSNGRLKIENNLLQVFDGTATLFERIALGDLNKDGSKYGLRIRGADGATILFDENGQTKEGFTDGYNKLENNSLNPVKLDIAQVVTRINNGTTTIDSSKIFMDNKTLKVAFETIETTVGEHETAISSQGASISALNNSIALKVDTQTYNTKMSSLDGSINTINSSLSTQSSAISVLQGQIVQKVTQVDIDNSISVNLKGKNLVKNANFEDGTTGWSPSTATIQVSENTLSQLPTARYGGVVQGFGAYNLANKGHKIYAKAIIKVSSSSVYFLFNDGVTQTTIGTGGVLNEFKAVSLTHTIKTNATGGYIKLQDARTSGWTESYIKEVLVVDLTAVFGVGKEPTQAWCDENITFNLISNNIQSQIDANQTRISTAESAITQHATDISLRVLTSTYNSKMSALDNSIISLDSRLDTAELKITDSAIVSTVRQSSLYISDLGSKANQSALDTTNSNLSNLTTRMSSAESAITQHATDISLRVLTTTYTSGLATKENTVYKQSTAPAHSNGRLWLDTSVTPNQLKRSTGSAWVKATPSTPGEVGAYSQTDGSSLASRVNAAELKITDSAITSTVKSNITGNDLTSIINQTATTVKLQASKINLVGAVTVLSDIVGNLGTITAGTINGAIFVSQLGNQKMLLDDGKVSFENITPVTEVDGTYWYETELNNNQLLISRIHDVTKSSKTLTLELGKIRSSSTAYTSAFSIEPNRFYLKNDNGVTFTDLEILLDNANKKINFNSNASIISINNSLNVTGTTYLSRETTISGGHTPLRILGTSTGVSNQAMVSFYNSIGARQGYVGYGDTVNNMLWFYNDTDEGFNFYGGAVHAGGMNCSSLDIKSTGATSFELRSTNGGTPFIDFSNDATIDYDARFILIADNVLSLQGAELQVLQNVWVQDNVSALSFTDRTPYYEGDALDEISKISSDGNGGIDHTTLPKFAKKMIRSRSKVAERTEKINGRVKKFDVTIKEEEEGRDLGAMISVLTVAVQQLTKITEDQKSKIKLLEDKLIS